jgi:hypothetical protein
LISSSLECFNSLHARCTVYPGLSLKICGYCWGQGNFMKPQIRLGRGGGGWDSSYEVTGHSGALGKNQALAPTLLHPPFMYLKHWTSRVCCLLTNWFVAHQMTWLVVHDLQRGGMLATQKMQNYKANFFSKLWSHNQKYELCLKLSMNL